MADFNSSTFATERYLSQLQSVSLEPSSASEPAPAPQSVFQMNSAPVAPAPVSSSQPHLESNFSADYMQYRDRIQREMGTARRSPNPTTPLPAASAPAEPVVVEPTVVSRTLPEPERMLEPEIAPEPSRDNPFSQLVFRKSDTDSKDVTRDRCPRPFAPWIRKLDAFGILGLFFGLLLSLVSLILTTGISAHALLAGISLLLSGGVMFLTSGALRGWNALYAK